MRRNKQVITIVLVIFLAIFLSGCTARMQAKKTKVTIQVSPAQIAINKAIFKTPVKFTGSGWKPGEVVSIELLLPPGVNIPAINAGEGAGVAVGKVDEKGKFGCEMGGMTKIITLFRGTLDPVTFKPITKTLNPLPSGKYTFKATGITSGSVATTSVDFVEPISK